MPCFILYLKAISKYKALGAYIRRGDLTEGFLRYDFGGLIFGGAYSWKGLFSEFYGILVLLIINFGTNSQLILIPFDERLTLETHFTVVI